MHSSGINPAKRPNSASGIPVYEVPPVLKVSDLTVQFDDSGCPVVNAASFEIQEAEILGLLGESGCGKSTTAHAITQLLPAGGRIARGSILFQGRDLVRLSEKDLRRIRGSGISLIFQEPALTLNPLMSVGDQVYDVVRAHAGDLRRIPLTRDRCRRDALEALSRTSFPLDLYSAYPHQLSGGQCQRVAIALAIAAKPSLLIADEPTSALDGRLQAEILQLIRDLRSRFGLAVLLVTHDPAILAGLADRVMVMHQGSIVEQGSVSRVFGDPRHDYTQRLMVAISDRWSGHGEEIPALWAGPPVNSAEAVKNAVLGVSGWVNAEPGDQGVLGPLVQAFGLSKRYVRRSWRRTWNGEASVEALREVDLTITRGSTLALVGESGSGKSTLARCLAQVEDPTSGEIWYEGVSLTRGTRHERLAIRRRVQLIFQDPGASLNPRLSATQIVAEPLDILEAGTRRQRRERVIELMGQVGLAPHLGARKALELSGGQRQRLALARALAPDPELLILDESFSALDLPLQAQMLELLAALKQSRRLTYLFISHDLNLARQIADRVAVMHQGRLVELASAADLFQHPRHPHTKDLMGAIPGLRAGLSDGIRRVQPNVAAAECAQ